VPDEIRPDRLYSPEDAARLLAQASDRGPRTLAEYPDLPYVPMGPRGGTRAYHGRDLLQLIEARKVVPGGLRRAS
jgi:hypothetical protein